MKKGKERRKDIHGKNEQGLLSFLLCRLLISCSDLLLISKGAFTARRSHSKPQDREQDDQEDTEIEGQGRRAPVFVLYIHV